MTKIAAALLFCLSVPLLSAGQIPASLQSGSSGYRSDNSDWWSQIRADEASVEVQKREPSSSNFKVLGIELGEDLFSRATARLGKVQKVERGDASTGRSQICYASAQAPPRIHLVFEKGEVTDSLYLFEDGSDWKGSNLCLQSNLVTKSLSVASGLRLGQTPAQVQAILGKPSKTTENKVIYFFTVDKKTPADGFARMRQANPKLSDEELHREYEFYSLTVYIEARFAQSQLTYLAVLKTETY